MKPFGILLYQLYLLQLENYRLGRYWKLFWRNIGKQSINAAQRHPLVWTTKAKLLFALSVGLAFLTAANTETGFDNQYLNIAAIIFEWWLFANFLAPIMLTLALIAIWPFDAVIKRLIVMRAKNKLKQFPNLKIIGITGSFGKTTMKECLAPILAEKYQVLKTPENINTPIGVSRLILNQLTAGTEILIVEMGAYQIGDIRQLCELSQPDIVVLTGINEAHLELFGGIQNTILAKFEIATFAKSNAILVLNEYSKLVKENYQKYAAGRQVFWYRNTGEIPYGLKAPLLGGYISATLNGSLLIAKELGLSDEQIKAGIGKIQPIPHRLQLIDSGNGVTVIDDSYNGNPAGAEEAIKVLAGFADKRKIYITPGLVEMAAATEAVHKQIGRQLASVADLVILIRNSATPFIAQGLSEAGFDQAKILWFESATKAHASLGLILKSGDAVMFQNDWPDNYA